MPSYLITGVSRGLGFEFLRQLSGDQNNIVVGIARDKASTGAKISQEMDGRSNITILEADITDYDALKHTVAATAEITGGGLDYLVANAAYVPKYDACDPIGVLDQNPQMFEAELDKTIKVNVTAQIHLITLYMPLVLNGNTKKVVSLASANADLETARRYDIASNSVYSISKAGLNMAIAKFSAQYREQGVLFLSVSPGLADTGQLDGLTPRQSEAVERLFQKFLAMEPNFRGPSTVEEAVKAVIAVWEKASVEHGDGGAFLTHRGETSNWL